MRKVIVTGGAGFIGSHLVTALVERGEQVLVIDDLSTGKPENLSHLKGRIEFHQETVRNVARMSELFAGVDCVFHLAALPSVSRSIENPVASHEACASATLEVLESARRASVRRVVYASSSSVYGDQPALIRRETDTPAPLSPYAVAKLAGEHYCRVYARSLGVETVALRYFNVFGPRQDPTSVYSAVIPRFITSLLEKTPPTIYGDGLQMRDFTYVGNVVEANVLAMDAASAIGAAMNVATGSSTNLLQLITSLCKHLKVDVAPVHESARIGDVLISQADITLARTLLGYRPVVTFDEGLEKCVRYYREAYGN